MILIWKSDVRRGPFRSGGVYKVVAVALDEAFKFKVRWDLLRCRHHVRIHSSLSFELAPNVLEEGRHRLLDGLDYVSLELLKRILHSYEVFAIIVLFENLFTKSIVDTPLEDVGIIRCVNLPS